METGLKVCDAMTRKPTIVGPDAKVLECAKLMKEHKIGSLVVSDENEVLGILTENDMVRRCLAEQKDPAVTTALELATEHVITVEPHMDVFEAIRLMQDHDIRHLPVIDEDKMVGFLTSNDILRLQPELFELLADYMDIREHERKLQKEILDSYK